MMFKLVLFGILMYIIPITFYEIGHAITFEKDALTARVSYSGDLVVRLRPVYVSSHCERAVCSYTQAELRVSV